MSKSKFLSSTSAASAVCLMAFLAACASTPQPIEELTRAKTLIEQAEKAGAQQYAGAELDRAREQLNAAEDANKDDDREKARKLAVQAASDAELASAKAQQAKAEDAAQKVDESVESLRKEADRNATQSGT